MHLLRKSDGEKSHILYSIRGKEFREGEKKREGKGRDNLRRVGSDGEGLVVKAGILAYTLSITNLINLASLVLYPFVSN